MRTLLILIPITLLLWGCADNNLYQRVYDLENTQNMLVDRVAIIEIDQIKQWVDAIPEEETTKADICVWLTDITVATYQAKDVFECIGNWEWYCNCIEKFASCWVKLSDIPKEYQNDFNPDCFNN